ncbi:MAG: DUF4406 domain-containing protein [Flavobacteriaceae bacterium]|nr:DUF4406 domain-containing protein [Flavobacteriaceae bacterium]
MIYIAGKISGLDPAEYEAKFNRVEAHLHQLGLKVINPLKLGVGHLPYEAQIAECLKVIETRGVTAIYMLKCWKNSDGARRELALVGTLNMHRRPRIDIYYEEFGQMKDIETDARAGTLRCLIPEN